MGRLDARGNARTTRIWERALNDEQSCGTSPIITHFVEHSLCRLCFCSKSVVPSKMAQWPAHRIHDANHIGHMSHCHGLIAMNKLSTQCDSPAQAAMGLFYIWNERRSVRALKIFLWGVGNRWSQNGDFQIRTHNFHFFCILSKSFHCPSNCCVSEWTCAWCVYSLIFGNSDAWIRNGRSICVQTMRNNLIWRQRPYRRQRFA